ncbi:MAG: hypothetical protein FJ255_06850 [Phycisphaerae bacterium]|nr:hypothetical protein [Phycisphaerae bacterium]
MACVASAALAQVMDPFYQQTGCYRIVDLGGPANVPGPLGGIAFDPADPNVLLVGGSANSAAAAIYRVPLIRGAGNVITGLVGNTGVHSTAPNIDGGLDFGPGDVLFFTGYPTHTLGQTRPGSASPDRIIALSTIPGLTGSVGTLRFVPPGFAGEGRLKIASYGTGYWYDTTVSPDGFGTFDVTRNPDVDVFIGGGPEGIVYVARGNPAFDVDSILVSEYNTGRIVTYEIDANGDPLPATQRIFLTGLSGTEGGTRDPLSGDFLFSTFRGGDRIILVTGFTLDCRANLNGDCIVDFNDLLEYLNLYNAGDPRADFNNDGTIDFNDFNDFLEFLNEFNRCA